MLSSMVKEHQAKQVKRKQDQGINIFQLQKINILLNF